MTYPLEIGYSSFKISAHLLFETLAFIIGFRYFLFLRAKNTDTLSESNRIWVLIAATFGAFFFSRLIGAFENPPVFFQSQNKLLYFYSNKTIIGGLIGGLIFVEIIKKIINEKKSSGDLFTYPLILAMIIGRIGCLTTGVYEDTYGETTTFFLGMNLGDGLIRHPVALYEILFLILLTILLKLIERKNHLKDGIRFQLFMIFYLFFRFCLDFIKPGYTFQLGIGTIQIVCLLGLIYYFRTILKLIFNFNKLYI